MCALEAVNVMWWAIVNLLHRGVERQTLEASKFKVRANQFMQSGYHHALVTLSKVAMYETDVQNRKMH
jgi:1,2-phenylacetyl-CoA epoxidase catalytic subunit